MTTELMYGFFPGGDYDPRKFTPDEECCTPEEMAAWRGACEARDRGYVCLPVARSGREVDGALVCGSMFGVGTYEVEVSDDDGGGEDAAQDEREERTLEREFLDDTAGENAGEAA